MKTIIITLVVVIIIGLSSCVQLPPQDWSGFAVLRHGKTTEYYYTNIYDRDSTRCIIIDDNNKTVSDKRWKRAK